MTHQGSRVAALTAGLVAGAAGLGAAQLAAAFVRPQSAPLIALGGAGIDRTPEWLKHWAIRQFGTHDKQVLLGSMLVGAGIVAALLGLLARTRPRLAGALLGTLAVAGAAAALTRPDAGPVDALPVLLGAATAAGVVAVLLPAAARAAPGDRRSFLALAGGAAALAAGSTLLGRSLAGRKSVAKARAATRLPAPARPAPPLPKAADLRIRGLTPFTTPNRDFYRVDTALVVPQVDPADWKLRVHGLVDRPLEITFDELLRRPLLEADVTLTCVSNEVGGEYAGNARWLGASLADLLREARVRSGADQVFSRSADGFTVSTPLDALMDGRDALLAVAMNGAPLPVGHGFPARMVVPGLYGYVSATKWVVDLKVSRFTDDRAYWTERGWADHGTVRTMARIDLPRPSADVKAGRIVVAGVAWAQHRGISAVQVRVDDGPWRTAQLAPVPNTDTWRQWVLEWDAVPGRHRIEARAVDGTGAVQSGDNADPFPNGATGWHQTTVTVHRN
ncbi:molybdopterin-dependent oxidoreductase [Actinomadura rayongensis]|uniref:Molybdopterin-dependent oxidoreductase n=1 Tax=Actinomadura rayongensis TaxID=1429076 RepID=A0A6I4W3C1_9ACTN|nr:molybdopterin-dependent oxidoreductase [Actinomadura rayongensis]MXQ63180.1 molybdopterin-dependent oxidoreductase [Actinomadura rayongensis]